MNLPFTRQKVVAVVDVAPGGASVAILSCPDGAPSTVRASARSVLSLEARTEAQSKALIGGQVKEAAEQAVKLYTAAGQNGAVTEAYVVVHAPWARSVIVRTHELYETDTKMSAEHIASIGKSSLANIRDVDSARLLEGSVIQVSLNGYPTASPHGMSARSLEVTSLASDCDESVQSAVEGSVHTVFPVARVSWRTGVRALFAVAREALPHESFLAVDMGVDNTHLISVHEGGIDQLVIPEGSRTVLSRIAGTRAPDEVLGILRMISRDACSSEACASITQALASAESDLVRIFGEALAKVSAKGKVPNDVVLIVHPSLESWLSAFLSRIDFAQFTITSMPLTIHDGRAMDIARWVGGADTSDALTIGSALVNIESRR